MALPLPANRAPSPFERFRTSMLAEMTPATRAVVKKLQAQMASAAKAAALVQYDIGACVKEIFDKPDKYGRLALAQIAEYLKIPGDIQRMVVLEGVAAAFPRAHVAEWSAKAGESGNALQISHWIRLARIGDRAEAEKYLMRIFEDGLTVRNLDEVIRSESASSRNKRTGGGKPLVPTNSIAADDEATQPISDVAKLEPGREHDAIREQLADAMNATSALIKTVEGLKRQIERRLGPTSECARGGVGG